MTSLVDPDLQAAAVAAQASGSVQIVAGAPAESLDTDSPFVDATDLEASWRLFDRAGLPWGGSDVFRIDYASPDGATFMPDGVFLDLQTAGFAGVAIGDVDGAPGYGPSDSEADHIANGGPYRTRGLRAMIRSVDGPVTAGTHEEHLVGDVDFAQDIGAWPGHRLLAEEELFPIGVTDMAPEARNRGTPLWSVIYGARAAGGRAIGPITTLARAGHLNHPSGVYDGLTTDQANEMQAWEILSLVIEGMTPALATRAEHYAHRVQTGSGEPILDVLADGFQALSDESWIAPWISYGQRMLPLVQQSWSEHNGEHNAEHGPGTTLSGNPIAPISSVLPDLRDAVLPGEMVDDADAAGDFLVPRALHSVWKDRATGQVLVMFANWSAVEAGGAAGTFCPWLYWDDCGDHSLEHNAEHEIVTPFAIDELGADGTVTSIATSCDDAVNLLCSGTPGTVSGQDVSLGAVPAFAIQAYRITQE